MLKKSDSFHKPLFIWAGGKNKMIKRYVQYMPDQVQEYSEPLFGAGAMYVYVQRVYKPKKCYINDINSGIMSIYRSIKFHFDEFCSYMEQLERKYIPLDKPDRKKLYYDIRAEHAYQFQNWNEVYESAVLYFLFLTSFNGIYQLNKNTNGRFGTPSGLLNHKTNLYSQQLVKTWNEMLQNTELYSADYSKCPVGDFVFFDPPYRESFTSYGTNWGDQETDDLVQYAMNLDSNVFLSNRDDGEGYFDKYSEHFNIDRFPITYTAGRRKKVDGAFEAKSATEILLHKKVSL